MSGQRPGPFSSPRRQGPAQTPKTGDRRPRSPDPILSSGDGDHAQEHVTKSPHTDRVVKRGKTGPNASPAQDVFRTAPIHPAPTTPARAVAPTTTSPPTPSGLPAEVPLMVLYHNLESALQAVGMMQSAILAGGLLPPTKDIEALLAQTQQLRDTLQSLDPKTPTPSMDELHPPRTDTYATAAKAQPRPARPRAQQTSIPKDVSPAQPKRTAKNAHQRTAPSTRLIIDLAGEIPTKTAHPDTLCNAINGTLAKPLAVSAVTTSRNGNLILHASAPMCSAEALVGRRSLIWKAIRPLLGLTDPREPYFYPADPWYKVVVHKVPLMEPGVVPRFHDVIDEVERRNALAGMQFRIGNVRFLHPRDKVPQTESSVRIDFIGEADARRFLRDGIFLFGSHCRVSRYKPRTASGNRPPGGK